MAVFVRRLLGIGKLPEDLHAQVEAEGLTPFSEGGEARDGAQAQGSAQKPEDVQAEGSAAAKDSAPPSQPSDAS